MALGFASTIALIFEFVNVLIISLYVVRFGNYVFNKYFVIDSIGAIMLVLVSLVGMAASCYSIGYLKKEVEKENVPFNKIWKYFALLQLFVLAMILAIITTNPILMWISIEATTLSTAFLISFYNKSSAIESAWKYLIINSVGLLIGFLGTLLFLYPATQNGFGFISWDMLAINALTFNPAILKIAFVLVLVGFGTKVGFVPMHTWLPDAHSKAPAPISGLLSGVLLNVAFLAILRFKNVADASIGKEFSNSLLIFFGILSIVVASFIIFIQKNYKRMLAYSSIEHMGIAALGFGLGGSGVFAALLHMIYHSLSKSILFLSSGNIFLKYESTKIKNIKGVVHSLPVTAILFIIGFLSITGIPPFGIFFTEFSILSVGIGTHPFVIILALFSLVLVFAGFLTHVSSMMFGENENSKEVGKENVWTILPIFILVVILIILSFYLPSDLLSLLQSAGIGY